MVNPTKEFKEKVVVKNAWNELANRLVFIENRDCWLFFGARDPKVIKDLWSTMDLENLLFFCFSILNQTELMFKLRRCRPVITKKQFLANLVITLETKKIGDKNCV